MTVYCSLADVYPLIGAMGVLRDHVEAVVNPPAAEVKATVPTATQGTAIITQVSAEIDGHLRAQGYSVPVTDTDALAYLTTVAMNGSGARILKSRFPAAKGAGSDEGAYAVLREDYLAGLALIDSGGLAIDAGDGTSASRFADGFDRDMATDPDGYAVRDTRSPRF